MSFEDIITVILFVFCTKVELIETNKYKSISKEKRKIYKQNNLIYNLSLELVKKFEKK